MKFFYQVVAGLSGLAQTIVALFGAGPGVPLVEDRPQRSQSPNLMRKRRGGRTN